MRIQDVPFDTIDWSDVERTEHVGARGVATWRTIVIGEIRVRMVEYSPGYLADHWCVKGHVVLCVNGALQTELQDGRMFTLRPGMSYHVSDNGEAHRSSTAHGATLFIVD